MLETDTWQTNMKENVDLTDTDPSILTCEQTIFYIFGSGMIFTCLYQLLYHVIVPKCLYARYSHIKTDPMARFVFADTFCALINAILLITLCLSLDNPLIIGFKDKHIYSITTTTQRKVCCIAIGYSLYNIICCCVVYNMKIKGKPDFFCVCYHLLTIICVGICIPAIYSGFICLFGVFWKEVMNPLLYIAKLIHIAIRRQTLSIIIMKGLYILFCIASIIIIGHCTFELLTIYSSLLIMYKIAAVLFIFFSVIYLTLRMIDFIKCCNEYKNGLIYNNYDEVNVVGSTSAEMTDIDEYDTDNDVEHDIDNKSELYNEILSESICSVQHYFVSGIMYTFFHCNRVAIYVLYAKQFNPSSIELSLILYGFNFWNGIAALIYGSIANQYGYDILILCLIILQFIGVTLEATAISFGMLFIGIMMAQVAITHIVIGYIAWILPLKYSTKYISYFYASFVFIYLLGPILAGIISYYVSYRMIFVINDCIIAAVFIYNLFFIRNTQKLLESKQLNVELLENRSNDEQFPICLERYNEDENDDNDDDLKWYQLPKLSISHWIMLSSIMYINSTVSIAENAIVLFYALYVIESLHSNVIYGTLGITIIAIGFIIGNSLVPICFEKYKISSIKFILLIIIICFIICLLLLMIFYPLIESITIYSILNLFYGFTFGIISMSSETLVLIIQPTKYSGKISGAKGLWRNWGQAITSFIITLCWNKTHLSLWTVSGYTMLIGIIIAFIMIYTNKYYEIYKEKQQQQETANNVR